MTENTVFTIGHSTHEREHFISLLNKYGVNCVIDVRSTPYSRIAPQFNKESLSVTLKEAGILYAHFDKEFGARQTAPSLLDEQGRVDFDKFRASAPFHDGLMRLNEARRQGYHVTLMCSEGNPFDCHRFSMISYQLAKSAIPVRHILPDGNIVENSDLEEWLLKKYVRKLPQSTLFETVTRETQLEVAYRLRSQEVAFSAVAPVTDQEPVKS